MGGGSFAVREPFTGRREGGEGGARLTRALWRIFFTFFFALKVVGPEETTAPGLQSMEGNQWFAIQITIGQVL